MYNKANNSTMLPLIGINGTKIVAQQVADTFFHFLNKWKTNTGIDIQGQIRDWGGAASHNDVPMSYQIEEI
jgi:hypothetical protein